MKTKINLGHLSALFMKSVWKRKDMFWHALCRHELNSVMWFLKSEKGAILRMWKIVHLFRKMLRLLFLVCESDLIMFWYSVLFWYGIWKPLAWCTDFVSDFVSALLCSALFGLVPTSLSLSAPTLETKWFYCGLSCVHTRGSEKNKGKISPLSLPGLATGDSTTLPQGWNMVSAL